MKVGVVISALLETEEKNKANIRKYTKHFYYEIVIPNIQKSRIKGAH